MSKESLSYLTDAPTIPMIRLVAGSAFRQNSQTSNKRVTDKSDFDKVRDGDPIFSRRIPSHPYWTDTVGLSPDEIEPKDKISALVAEAKIETHNQTMAAVKKLGIEEEYAALKR